MVKLQKSIEKRDALLRATLSLVNSGGIQSTSMAKIAAIAGVSPATIYLYFKNKQDLVNQLYLTVKSEFTHKAFEGYNANGPVKQSFEQIWFNMAHFKLNHRAESSFLSQCDNTPMIDEMTRNEGLKLIQPLFDLMLRGQNKGIIKSISPYLFYAYTIYPMSFLLNMQKRALFELTDQCLKESWALAWNSIRI
ncbi:MAG: TetR/AcrR family transcriptional regulator [Salinivirgaceae bacterium]|nr:TetR/AcrR family transcriptional regulator [Salinivirgaceae bacterium]